MTLFKLLPLLAALIAGTAMAHGGYTNSAGCHWHDPPSWEELNSTGCDGNAVALEHENDDEGDFCTDCTLDIVEGTGMLFEAIEFVWGQGGQHEVGTITFTAEGEEDQEITFQCDKRCVIVLKDEFGDERGAVVWWPTPEPSEGDE